MPFKRGAPPGNRNRLKHGRYTAERLAQRRRVVEALRDVRTALLMARYEVAIFKRQSKTRAGLSRKAGLWRKRGSRVAEPSNRMTSNKPIIVVCRTRSGSNLLCDYLGQAENVVSFGEILKPERPTRLNKFMLRLAIDRVELDRLHELQANDRVAFWRKVRECCMGRDLRPAAKMFYGGAPPDDPLWSELEDALILHLIRENVLATLVSAKLAQRAHRWAGRPVGYDSGSVVVTRQECLEGLSLLRERVERNRARFSRGEYKEIAYDTVADPKQASIALRRVAGTPVSLVARLERQRQRPLSDILANYSDVSDFDRNIELIDRTYDLGQ